MRCMPAVSATLRAATASDSVAIFPVSKARCVAKWRTDVALQGALTALAARHETLRTRFVERDGHFLQAVLPLDDPAAAPPLVTRRLTMRGDEQELGAVVANATAQPYRLLSGDVPLRAVLVPGALRGQDLLVMCMHHILRCVTRTHLPVLLPPVFLHGVARHGLEGLGSVWGGRSQCMLPLD